MDIVWFTFVVVSSFQVNCILVPCCDYGSNDYSVLALQSFGTKASTRSWRWWMWLPVIPSCAFRTFRQLLGQQIDRRFFKKPSLDSLFRFPLQLISEVCMLRYIDDANGNYTISYGSSSLQCSRSDWSSKAFPIWQTLRTSRGSKSWKKILHRFWIRNTLFKKMLFMKHVCDINYTEIYRPGLI